MSFDFAQDEVGLLMDNRLCKWKAPLILSEVEGSGPMSAVGQFFHTLERGDSGGRRAVALGTRFRGYDGK